MNGAMIVVVALLLSSNAACGRRASESTSGSGGGSGGGSSTGSGATSGSNATSSGAGSGAGSGSSISGIGSGTGSGIGSGSDSGSARDPIADENPTLAVVTAAFGGKVPSLPQLSKDGRTAAVELDTQLDLSSASTYAVAFIGTGIGTGTGTGTGTRTRTGAGAGTGTGAGAGAARNRITLVDGKLAHVLLEGGSEPGKPPVIDTASLAKTAATITKRLQDEGFSAFEHKIEELAPGEPISVGPAKLQLAESDAGKLSIVVIDGKGKPTTKDTVNPVVMGKVAGLECVSQPIPRHAWVDTPRKRLLVEVGWNAGPDQCNAPDAAYRLYALP